MKRILPFILFIILSSGASSQRIMEYLDRGLVAMRMSNDSVFISWRMLGDDPDDVAFDLYRQTGHNKSVKINSSPCGYQHASLMQLQTFQKTTSILYLPVVKALKKANRIFLKPALPSGSILKSRSELRRDIPPMTFPPAISMQTGNMRSSCIRPGEALILLQQAFQVFRFSRHTNSMERSCGK
jgi:hypothetical protein